MQQHSHRQTKGTNKKHQQAFTHMAYCPNTLSLEDIYIVARREMRREDEERE